MLEDRGLHLHLYLVLIVWRIAVPRNCEKARTYVQAIQHNITSTDALMAACQGPMRKVADGVLYGRE